MWLLWFAANDYLPRSKALGNMHYTIYDSILVSRARPYTNSICYTVNFIPDDKVFRILKEVKDRYMYW